MIRRLCALAIVAVAANAFADEEPRWNSAFVHFSLRADGSLHISDQLDFDVKPEIHVIERRYWTDAEQHVTFDGVTRINLETSEETALTRGSLDAPDRFDSPSPGKVAWTVAPGSFRYVVDSTISDAVIPGWSLARGPLTYNPHTLSDPPTRLRELLPIWREALRKPRTLYGCAPSSASPPLASATTPPPGSKPSASIASERRRRPRRGGGRRWRGESPDYANSLRSRIFRAFV